MARCGNCGKANRDGALFCQDCGQPLDARAPGAADAGDARPGTPARAIAAAGPAAGPAAGGQAAASSTSLPESTDGRGLAPVRVGCPKCGQPTPAGFSFCQHCGTRMQPGSSDAVPRLPASAVPAPAAGAASAAGAPITTSGRGGAGGDLRTTGAPRSSAPPTLENTPEPMRGARPNSGGSGPLRGRLVLLRRDGSDGETITMTGESSFDIGRSEGGRTFPDDVYMATRHARFILQGGIVRVRSLDQTNGVLIQIREPFELQSGDVFYMGRELLRFEMLPSEERDPPPVFEHGVRLFGTTPRESWGRLRQLTSTGTTRDLWHLCRSEVRIGREEGDIVFPDDEFMSRRHAVVTRHGNRVRIEDQHSSNGTYVRLRGDRELQASDVLRIGDQVLRFEP